MPKIPRLCLGIGLLSLVAACEDDTAVPRGNADGGGQVQVEGGVRADAGADAAQSPAADGSIGSDSSTDSAPLGRALYVSPNGLDGNAGTADSPLKTIAKALSEAKAGDTVWLLDGTWNAMVEPDLSVGTAGPCRSGAGLVVPEGVTLQAVNPRQATVEVTGSHGVCLTSGTVRNVHFHRPTGQGGHVEVGGKGKARIEGSTFTGVFGCGGSGWEAAVETADEADVTISGAGLATSLIDGDGCQFVVARGKSSVTVANAILRAGKNAATSGTGVLIATEGSTVRLLATTLENVGLTQRGVALGVGTAIIEEGSVVKGFTHGVTVRDKGSSIVVKGSSFLGNTGSGILVEYGYTGGAVVTATDSTFDGNGTAITQGTGTGLELNLQNTKVVNNTQNGLSLTSNGQLTVLGGEISGNKMNGISFASGPGATCALTVRNAKITGNMDAGLRLSCDGASVPSLGTAGAPGGNTLTGNGSTGVYVNSPGLNVYAVGNTWEANVQAANAQGRFTVDGAGAKLDVTTGSGKNYQVLQGTLRLAENP